MKFIDSTRGKKAAQLSIGLIFLMFFLGGCITPRSQAENTLKCQAAEQAVSQAEQAYEVVSQEFAISQNNTNTIEQLIKALQTLEETQEKAFEVCYPRSLD
jgi:outer membrane lipoprotein-sorting protein